MRGDMKKKFKKYWIRSRRIMFLVKLIKKCSMKQTSYPLRLSWNEFNAASARVRYAIGEIG